MPPSSIGKTNKKGVASSKVSAKDSKEVIKRLEEEI
jgi:hypothetical protein